MLTSISSMFMFFLYIFTFLQNINTTKVFFFFFCQNPPSNYVKQILREREDNPTNKKSKWWPINYNNDQIQIILF